MYAWILQHDDRWSFIALYVSLAVVLSMWISLFWLVALVVVHFAFECVRQAAAGARGFEVFTLAGWEVKLDVALVFFALALSLYMDVVLGVLGLQAAARAGAAANASLRAGGRVLAWERAIRGVLLSADDAAQVGRVLVRQRVNGQAAQHDGGDAETGGGTATLLVAAEPEQPRGGTVAALPVLERSSGWRGAWGIGDRIAVGLAVACVALILAAPGLKGGTFADAVAVMAAELHPLPR